MMCGGALSRTSRNTRVTERLSVSLLSTFKGNPPVPPALHSNSRPCSGGALREYTALRRQSQDGFSRLARVERQVFYPRLAGGDEAGCTVSGVGAGQQAGGEGGERVPFRYSHQIPEVFPITRRRAFKRARPVRSALRVGTSRSREACARTSVCA